MRVASPPLFTLTARDLMTRVLVCLREDMPLREAAGLLLQHQVSGAPVVDAQGVCVGVLSSLDFLRFTEKRPESYHKAPTELPVTCSFQIKHRTAAGKDEVLCILAPGVCPLQRHRFNAGEPERLVCIQPHCVLADWQIVDVERLPTEKVGNFMTTNPVTVAPATPIRTIARLMIDAHIHRVFVLSEDVKPLGIVSSTDILAALAYTEENR